LLNTLILLTGQILYTYLLRHIEYPHSNQAFQPKSRCIYIFFNRLNDHRIISITVSEGYICGDVNDDGTIDILDIVFIINYKYKTGPPPDPLVSGDVNSDGDINILDVVSLINYKYKGGTEPNCP